MPANEGRPADSSAPTAQKTAELDLRDFHRECGGIFQLSIFDLPAAALCAAAAILGDPLALAYLEAIGFLRNKIRDRQRPVCIACTTVFWPKRPPSGVAVCMPMSGHVGMALVSGVCKPCMDRGNDFIMARALAHGRAIWPDLRAVDRANIGHKAGRA